MREAATLYVRPDARSNVAHLVCILVGLLAAPNAFPADLTPERVTGDAVDGAVDRAVAWIKRQRGPQGHWERDDSADTRFYGGDTGLALLALLYAGESPRQDEMRESIRWLSEASLSDTYTIGTRAHVLALVDGPTYRSALRRDVDWLQSNVHPAGSPHAGAYDYKAPSGRYDNSNSQYGVLGMWMASEYAFNVPGHYWQLVGGHWLEDQNGDGGWSYTGSGRSTGSMTAAGLATLFVALDRYYLDRRDERDTVLAAIERGLDWMGREFTTENPHGEDRWRYYYLYGVERVGRACGYKYFRGRDWFRAGSAALLNDQQADGAWPGAGSGGFSMSTLRNTTFAVMFLCHGRAPLMFNKLQYVPPAGSSFADDAGGEQASEIIGEGWAQDADRGRATRRQPDRDSRPRRELRRRQPRNPPPPLEQDWNLQMRDVAGLVRYTQGSLERLLNWQIVRLDGSLADLLEAPVLYLSGSRAWEFSDNDVARLRAYVDRGGLIFTVPAEGGDAFTTSMEALAARLFPQLPLQPMPSDHPVLTSATRTQLDDPPPLREVSNGRRSLMMIAERDIAESWHRYRPRSRADDFELGVNLFLYATDITPQGNRLNRVALDDSATPIRGRTSIVRIRHDGDWDPEPAGWRRFAAHLRNQTGIVAEVINGVRLDAAELQEHDVAHITGDGELTLSEDEREGLRRFLTRGGTLLADAAGGSQAFTESLSSEVSEILRTSPVPIPEGSGLITGEGLRGGVDVRPVGYRRAARRVSLGRPYPRLLGFRLATRYPVILSPLDLSVGLIGAPVFGNVGYDDQTTLDLARNLVLYAQLPLADKARVATE